MNNYEIKYLSLLQEILCDGVVSDNRTGIKTRKIWGAQLKINLQEGFPLITTKKLHWKSVVHELLWMIKGDTNIQYLLKNGVTFWTEWPYRKYLESGKKDNTGGCVFGSTAFTQKEFEQTIINNDEFTKQWGSIGEYGYGGMWRNFPFYNSGTETQSLYGHKIVAELGTVDQLTKTINDLKTNPDSRRIIITAWHPYHSNNIDDALLPACHNYIQFGTEELTHDERFALYVKAGGDLTTMSTSNMVELFDVMNIPKHRLNCYYSMRSNDFFLGAPYNNAFYALLTHLVANHLNMIPNRLVYTAADVHLYENHIEQSNLQLTRTPKTLPQIKIKTPGKSIFDITYDDIELIGYEPWPAIKGEVAV